MKMADSSQIPYMILRVFQRRKLGKGVRVLKKNYELTKAAVVASD